MNQILVLTDSYLKYHVCDSVTSLQFSIAHCCVYLCNKLDDFDKDIERHVSWYHTAGSFGEKCCYNGVEATVDTEKRTRYEDTLNKHYTTF